MGTKPGERMMGHLEQQVEAISVEFNAQEITKTLWAFATTGIKPGELMMGQLGWRVEVVSGEFKPQKVANTRCVANVLF
jgi:hypothetical protein